MTLSKHHRSKPASFVVGKCSKGVRSLGETHSAITKTIRLKCFCLVGCALAVHLDGSIGPLAQAWVSQQRRPLRKSWKMERTRRLWFATPTHAPMSDDSRDTFSDDSSSIQKPLEGVVCLVTGASRGIGKGIALELGCQGATVYVTGTTSTTDPSETSEPANETIETTASEVTLAGGHGIAVLCDHAQDQQVQELFQRIENESGRLDILVNNAFRLPDGGAAALQQKFWEQGPSSWDPIHEVGLRSHYVATCYAVPLMMQQDPSALARPLVIMISSFGGLTYTFNVAYGVGKAGLDRMAKDMAVDLRDNGISVMSLWPGLVATERTERLVASGEWEKYVKIPLGDNAESPRFTGRAVVALALDPDNMAKSGTCQVVAELADEYGFFDINGKRPPSIRSLRFLLPTYGFNEEQREKIPSSWIPNWKLPFWVMAQGQPPGDELN